MLGLSLMASSAGATEVSVIGLFSGKAMVSINGGKQRVLSAGQTTPEGVKLISADSQSALLEIDGVQRRLGLGSRIGGGDNNSGTASVTLNADGQGHFVTTGSINGATTRFLVDTGASNIAMSTSEAKRLGIAYSHGARGYSQTANGIVPIYVVTLNTVKLGDIVLNQVEASIIEGTDLPVTLLGMSFLRRTEMRREGNTMTLTKKY